MEKFSKNSSIHKLNETAQIDMLTLQNRSREELIQLAKDLSKGRFDKESNQRRQILQMIADRLAEKSVSPP